MVETLVSALVAAGLCLSGGYLFGVRRGAAARDVLRRHLAARADETHAARAEAVAMRTELQVARLEAQDVRAELTGARAEVQGMVHETARATRLAEADRTALENVRAELDEVRRRPAPTSQGPEVLRAQIDAALKGLLGPLLERDAEARNLRETVQGLLGPMVERERLGLVFSQLNGEAQTRGELPRLLTLIAERGGFATVLLSDAEGLPLATNDTRENPETLAATTSLLLTLADRIAQGGDPPPIAAALRDEDNRVVLHRIFHVGHERYVLTAVNKGVFLPPDVLDPTLVQIERLLAEQAIP
jgi:hypothetical protein